MSETVIPKNSLWQFLEKEHLDTEGVLTDEQWNIFLNQYNDCFADEASCLGQEMFREFCINWLRLEDYR